MGKFLKMENGTIVRYLVSCRPGVGGFSTQKVVTSEGHYDFDEAYNGGNSLTFEGTWMQIAVKMSCFIQLRFQLVIRLSSLTHKKAVKGTKCLVCSCDQTGLFRV